MGAFVIPLTKNQVALVDPEDAWVALYKWKANPCTRGLKKYRALGYVDGKRIYMHRLLMQAPTGACVDHVNGDSLDNRRKNLRLASPSQNRANEDNRGNVVGLRGVFPNGDGYMARIKQNRKATYLGTFRTAEEAHAAYRLASIAMFGEFSYFNRTQENG